MVFAWGLPTTVRVSDGRTYPFYNIRREEMRWMERCGVHCSRADLCLELYAPIVLELYAAVFFPDIQAARVALGG